MENLWRFYDDNLGISGVCIGDNKEDARKNAEYYLSIQFDDIRDMQNMNVKPATTHPKATEEIDGMIAMIQTLVDKGYAYEVDGDVYFSTKKFKDYGKLSGQNLEDLQAGARINVDERKKDPMDFAIWKSQKPGEPAWKSPWGMGRPGWHIECSCM